MRHKLRAMGLLLTPPLLQNRLLSRIPTVLGEDKARLRLEALRGWTYTNQVSLITPTSAYVAKEQRAFFAAHPPA